jgi:microsomal dipeptidase-like Zn-dependent dipeptidase
VIYALKFKQKMSATPLIIDLHCHPNLKAFNSGHPLPKKNLWENIDHNLDSKLAQNVHAVSEHIHKSSQCSLELMFQGNVRAFNISLYPIEREFLNMRNVPKWIIGKKNVQRMQEVITGFDLERIIHLTEHVDYFAELKAEYKYVEKQQRVSPDKEKEFVLVNSFSELQSALKDPKKLAGIISIEGAHAFFTNWEETDASEQEELEKLLSKNIDTIKKWNFPPFTVNLSHHFWNRLSGHATSFKAPINSLVNQNKGKDRGIQPLGWHVIRLLLSKENGKRIIIDTKHMSVAARKEYFDFVRNYNFLNPNDKIPLLSSHAGVSGFSTLDASISENDTPRKARFHKFYKWSINISNEEIKAVHESEGLIGLMMDKGMLGGIRTIKTISALENEKKKRKEFARMFWENAFQIVKAVGEKSGWDIIGLGTDYDGTITHIDPYESAAKLPDFCRDLTEYLEQTEFNKNFWFDYNPSELVAKIMSGNSLRFYERFFV